MNTTDSPLQAINYKDKNKLENMPLPEGIEPESSDSSEFAGAEESPEESEDEEQAAKGKRRKLANVQLKSPAATPNKTPRKTPSKTPKKTPNKKTPSKTPSQTPRKTPSKTPSKMRQIKGSVDTEPKQTTMSKTKQRANPRTPSRKSAQQPTTPKRSQPSQQQSPQETPNQSGQPKNQNQLRQNPSSPTKTSCQPVPPKLVVGPSDLYEPEARLSVVQPTLFPTRAATPRQTVSMATSAMESPTLTGTLTDTEASHNPTKV